MSAYILDTETTGVSGTDQVIELALYKADPLFIEKEALSDNVTTFMRSISEYIEVSRYRPTVPIHQRAFDVHQIGLHHLKDKPSPLSIHIPEDATYIVGHNISFDKRLLKQSNPSLSKRLDSLNYICTKDLAVKVKKYIGINYPNVQLTTLVKHHFPTQVVLTNPIHSAGEDVLKTIMIVCKMIEYLPKLATWESLYDYLETVNSRKPKGN